MNRPIPVPPDALHGATPAVLQPRSRLSDKHILEFWNAIAQAGATLEATLIKFARLIEAEARR